MPEYAKTCQNRPRIASKKQYLAQNLQLPVLEEELCQVKLQYGRNLSLYQRAYRDHDNARKWLKKKKNQDKPKEVIDKYQMMITQNKEFAKKYKKVMNIESLIRKRKKEEASYAVHYERFLNSYKPEERDRVMKRQIALNKEPEQRMAKQSSKWKIRAGCSIEVPTRTRRLTNTYGRRAEASSLSANNMGDGEKMPASK